MAKESLVPIDSALNLYKRRSETPLQTIERYVSAHPEYKGSKMTYAGRLDPMAEGVLIVLSGEKNKERDAYTRLDKDYEFEFILGVDTDTHDILGKITKVTTGGASDKKVKEALKRYTGAFKQRYPAYSSKVVDGVPLFDLARRGKIGSVILPEHEVEVTSIELIGSRSVTKNEMQRYIEEGINEVFGDFRQKEILKGWREYFESSAPNGIIVYSAKVTCGSGFYVRQLVSDLGKDLGTGAVTTKILRTRVGQFKIESSIK